jgi:hypothetical protein
MQATRVKTVVLPEREVRVHVSDEFQPGETVEVLILSEGKPAVSGRGNGKAISDVLKTIHEQFPRPEISREELDRRIQEERDSWE